MKKEGKLVLPKRLYIHVNTAYNGPYGFGGPKFYCNDDLGNLGRTECEIGEYILFAKGTTRVSFEVDTEK